MYDYFIDVDTLKCFLFSTFIHKLFIKTPFFEKSLIKITYATENNLFKFII